MQKGSSEIEYLFYQFYQILSIFFKYGYFINNVYICLFWLIKLSIFKEQIRQEMRMLVNIT